MRRRDLVLLVEASDRLCAGRSPSALLSAVAMIDPPEIIRINSARVACDGSGEVTAVLGHPRVWLEIDAKGYVECGYCDRRYVLIGGDADRAADSAQ